MLLYLFLGLALVYGIKSLAADTEEKKQKAKESAQSNLIAAGVVVAFVVILSIALAS